MIVPLQRPARIKWGFNLVYGYVSRNLNGRPHLRTNLKPDPWSALLSSTTVIPARFGGDLSRMSLAKFGRHAFKIVCMDRRPIKGIKSSDALKSYLSIVVTTMSPKAVATVTFRSDALGLTIF